MQSSEFQKGPVLCQPFVEVIPFPNIFNRKTATLLLFTRSSVSTFIAIYKANSGQSFRKTKLTIFSNIENYWGAAPTPPVKSVPGETPQCLTVFGRGVFGAAKIPNFASISGSILGTKVANTPLERYWGWPPML